MTSSCVYLQSLQAALGAQISSLTLQVNANSSREQDLKSQLEEQVSYAVTL
jgi:hypothetical protein